MGDVEECWSSWLADTEGEPTAADTYANTGTNTNANTYAMTCATSAAAEVDSESESAWWARGPREAEDTEAESVLWRGRDLHGATKQ